MFKDIKKKKRELSKENTLEVLKNGREGILSTISENGYPYGIAVNYV
ncbi:pyridoxamine 5'-phosphate oxidase family protein, partial [Clostridium perfringens]|nr:pyridoxamine 5'-phosphate oxidase family protein [Clostridium perfringens]